MFGTIELDAEDEDDAKELLDDELFGVDRDGLDYTITALD
jgi:hypothetical protein